MNIIYIYGSQDGEHLRAEINGTGVTLISHEARSESQRWPYNVINLYRDKYLATIPLGTWMEIAEMQR